MASNKGKLDPITFIYGMGAAIVLVGAMFKFLGWNFANEMFIIGLSVEAIVFTISAFERKVEDKEYNWEQVFPQLENGENKGGVDTTGYQSAMAQFSQTLGQLSTGLKEMTESVNQIKSELKSSADQSASMQKTMTEFNQLMNNYNDNLRKINDQYNSFIQNK